MYELDVHHKPVYSCTQTTVVFNQSYTWEQKTVYRAMREELKNLVESGLAVRVRGRKRKPISISSWGPQVPGLLSREAIHLPAPWDVHGPNEEGKTHTASHPLCGCPTDGSHLVAYFPIQRVEDGSVLSKISRYQSSTSHFQVAFLLEDSHPFKSEWLSSSGISLSGT